MYSYMFLPSTLSLLLVVFAKMRKFFESDSVSVFVSHAKIRYSTGQTRTRRELLRAGGWVQRSTDARLDCGLIRAARVASTAADNGPQYLRGARLEFADSISSGEQFSAAAFLIAFSNANRTSERRGAAGRPNTRTQKIDSIVHKLNKSNEKASSVGKGRMARKRLNVKMENERVVKPNARCDARRREN